MQNLISARKVTITLECSHELIFDSNHAPKKKDILWCVRCQAEKKCITVIQIRWLARCNNCAYRGVTSSDYDTVVRLASRHMVSKGHQAYVKRATK